MASKRGHITASSAADEPGDKRLRVAPFIAPALTGIHAIAFDVLCQVVVYAPFAARLKAVSLVCKRWRAAVLHSIKSVSFFPVLADELSTLIQRFPSLTNVTLPCAVAPSALPRSVQALTLRVDARPDEHLDGLFYAAHFPNLTSLCLRAGLADVPQDPPVLNTVRIHSTQLTELSCNQLDPSEIRALLTCRWPVLRKLSLVFLPEEDVISLLDALPALAELHFSCPQTWDVMRLPDRAVRLLSSLFVLTGFTAECLARLNELCPTCSISALHPPSFAFMRDHEAQFARSLSRMDLGVHSWQWLARFQALETLHITPGDALASAMPEPVSLPRLKVVTLGTPAEPWPADEGILYATLLLRTQPRIQHLGLCLTFGRVARRDYTGRFVALVSLADSLGLRHFDVTAPDIPSFNVPGLQFGWSVLKLNTPASVY